MKIKVNKIIKNFIPQIYLLKSGELKMKIEKVVINNICGIKHIKIQFDKRLNLICGTNGVGKTTILKSIAYEFFNGKDDFLKKCYGSEEGNISIWIEGIEKPFKYIIKHFINGFDESKSEITKDSRNLLYFLPLRTVEYNKINISSSESTTCDNRIYYARPLTFGNVEEIKGWFIKKFLFSKIDGALNEFEKNNFQLSKDIFKLLDNNLNIKTVNTDFEIILKNNNTEIYFDMLSDGYKSCIITLLSMIKEIEYRYPYINVVDFN